MRVLFLVSRLPYPPWRGDQVRAYHQLRQLAGRHEITVALAGKAPTMEDRAHVEGLGVEVAVIPVSAAGVVARVATRLPFDRRPLQSLPFTGRAARRRVAELAGSADLVHAQLARIAPLLPEDGPPIVLDMIDAMSANLRRRARLDRSLRGLASHRESRRLLRYEARLERMGVTVVAATDADATALGEGVIVVPNGVDLEQFRFRAEGRDASALVFAGNLGYFPNVDAARVAAAEVLPIVRGALPGATLTLAGARPARAVRRLRRLPGVDLVAEPADLGAVVARAAVAVIPMRAGSGVQNKLLEAMAVGTPVVTTPRAAAAVGATPGEHLMTGADPASLARAALGLLGDDEAARAMAARARHFVETRFGWADATELLERVWLRAASAT